MPGTLQILPNLFLTSTLLDSIILHLTVEKAIVKKFRN